MDPKKHPEAPLLHSHTKAAIVCALVYQPNHYGGTVQSACAVVSEALAEAAEALIALGAPVDVLERIHAGACVRLATARYAARTQGEAL